MSRARVRAVALCLVAALGMLAAAVSRDFGGAVVEA